MYHRLRGKLIALEDLEAIVEAGHFDYSVSVPQFAQRHLQDLMGKEVTLHLMHYIDGNPQKGRLVPRLIGFLSPLEREFFDTLCSVDGVGVKTALKALVRPVRDVAIAIEEQNVKELSTLPGIGPAAAERIVAKLRRKMTKFALLVAKDAPDRGVPIKRDLVNETFDALVSLGHTPTEARQKIDAAIGSGAKYKTVEDLLVAIYQQER